MTQPDPHMPITMEMIYAQLMVINVKLDQATSGVADHELRLRSLERSRWPLTSVTILVAMAAAVIGLVNLLTR